MEANLGGPRGDADSPSLGKSPLQRSLSRGGRLSRRSSLNISTTAAVELVVSDLALDEQTVLKLSAMAVDEEKKADLRRSFIKKSRQSPLSSTASVRLLGSTPRRSSMDSALELDQTRERIPHSTVDATRSGTSTADGTSEDAVSASASSGVDLAVGTQATDCSDGVPFSSGHVHRRYLRRSVSDAALQPGVYLSGYCTPVNVSVSSRHFSSSSSSDSSAVFSNDSASRTVSVSSSDTPDSLPRAQQSLSRRSSLKPNVGFSDAVVAVSPIPEGSSENSSMSPTPPPPPPSHPSTSDSSCPPSAPPLPQAMHVNDTAQTNSQGERLQRRKTIAVIDENVVELDEALDVIREQEDEIAVLHYQLEDLKDQFEELQMMADENEHLLRQANDSSARLQHVETVRNQEVKGLRVMVGFFQEVLAGFNVSLPSIEAVHDVEHRLQELERVETSLKEHVWAMSQPKVQSKSSAHADSQRASAASPIMSLPSAILSRVRTPDWLGRQARSPSHSPLRLSRESSVDPPVFASDPHSPQKTSESRLVRHSVAGVLRHCNSPTVSYDRTIDITSNTSTSAQSLAVAGRSQTLPVTSSEAAAAVVHDHPYAFPSRRLTTHSSAVLHDHDYAHSSDGSHPSESSYAVQGVERLHDVLPPGDLSGIGSRPSSHNSCEGIDGPMSGGQIKRSMSPALVAGVAAKRQQSLAEQKTCHSETSREPQSQTPQTRDWRGRPPPPIRNESIPKPQTMWHDYSGQSKRQGPTSATISESAPHTVANGAIGQQALNNGTTVMAHAEPALRSTLPVGKSEAETFSSPVLTTSTQTNSWAATSKSSELQQLTSRNLQDVRRHAVTDASGVVDSASPPLSPFSRRRPSLQSAEPIRQPVRSPPSTVAAGTGGQYETEV